MLMLTNEMAHTIDAFKCYKIWFLDNEATGSIIASPDWDTSPQQPYPSTALIYKMASLTFIHLCGTDCGPLL